MERKPCVYLLASEPNGTLYVGVTSDLVKRVWQHKRHVVEGFTQKYSVDRLVWYELHETMLSAISREKAIKFWKRVEDPRHRSDEPRMAGFVRRSCMRSCMT